MVETPGTIYTAEIVSITNPDTIVFKFNGSDDRSCRIFGIDALETTYAITTWASAYADLTAELQTQEFGDLALARLTTLLISDTGEASPVGLDLTVTIRGTDSVTDDLLVSVVNNEGNDIGALLCITGHAVVIESEASTIESIYNTYKTNEVTAKNADLVIWSATIPYTPATYRAEVDVAARRILYIVIDEVNPAEDATNAYLDTSIDFTFSREIESSYISTSYFKLYTTNEALTEFGTQISFTITKSGNQVSLVPDILLTKETYYLILIIGGTSGITAIDAANLEANIMLQFMTGVIVRPISDIETSIDHIDVWVDGDDTDDSDTLESRDFFSTGDTSAVFPIKCVDTVPANHSVGVYGLDRLIYIYDDDVQFVVPANMLYGKYNDLPVDADPLGFDKFIEASDSSIENNLLYFDIDMLSSGETENREYTFRLPKYTVKGITKTNFDVEDRYIRFTGKLTPLYAIPEDIKLSLKAYSSNATIDILDYDLYKLIHKKSTWTDAQYGTVTTVLELLTRNQLVICLILKDIIGNGMLAGGGIKSRKLLMTQVDYYDSNFDNIMDQLDDCITVNMNGGSETVIYNGIKSGNHLIRQGKLYKDYR